MEVPQRIQDAWQKLSDGARYVDIENEVKISRQRFDVLRKKYGLPSPRSVRHEEKEKNRPETEVELVERMRAEGWFTTAETAEIIGIGPEVVALQMRRGRIACKKIGRRLFVHRDAIDTYVRNIRRKKAAESFPQGDEYHTLSYYVTEYEVPRHRIYYATKRGTLPSEKFGMNVIIREQDFLVWKETIV